MISRAQFISLVAAAGASSAYSSKELAQALSVPLGTLNGWLSDKRAFPPAEIGARRRRIYDVVTIKRIAVYADCLENSYGMDASDVRLMMASVDVDELWQYYLKSAADFASYITSQRVSLKGSVNG